MEASSVENGKSYHCILQPAFKTERQTSVFRTTYRVNDPLAQQYPWLTADLEVITKGLQPYTRSFKLVHAIHPIMRSIFEVQHKYKTWTEPKQHPGSGEEGTPILFEVENWKVAFCADELRKRVKETIPIVDMSTIRIAFDVLDPKAVYTSQMEPLSLGIMLKFVYIFRNFIVEREGDDDMEVKDSASAD